MKKKPIKKNATVKRRAAGACAAAPDKGGAPAAGPDRDRLEREIRELRAELRRKDREMKRREGGATEGDVTAHGCKAMVDGSPIPQFMISRDHRVLYWNSAMEAISGIRAGEVVGTKRHWSAFYRKRRPTLADLLVDGKIETMQEWYADKCRKSKYVAGAYEGTDYFVGKEGRGVWLYFTAVLIKDKDGALIGALETLEDISERMRVQEALQQSEERFRQIAESTEEWIWEVDSRGMLTYSNSVVEEILGYRPEDIVGKKHFYDFMVPDSREKIKKEALEYFAARRPLKKFVNYNVHRNGSIVIMETSGIPVVSAKGKLLGYRGADTNITERVRAEEALRESESYYRLLAENMDDVIFVLDNKMRFTYVSPSIRRLRGMEPEEAMRQSPEEMMPADSLLKLSAVFDASRANLVSGRKQFELIEVEQYRRDGSTVWVELLIKALRDERGAQIGFIGVARDISERRRLHGVLRESEDRYRLLVENAGEIIAVAQNGFLKYVNTMAVKMTGFSPEELGSRPFIEFIHPEDRPMVAERYRRRQTGGEPPAVYQFRVLHKDGGFRWVEINAVSISWEGSYATLNFFKDVTDRRRIEDALHESERKYRELVENANSMILRMDADGVVTFFNEYAQEFFGFKLDEILGRNIIGTIVPEVDSSGADLKSLMMNLLADPEKFKSNENENIKKSGERVWIAWTNKVIGKTKGNSREILCIGNDITPQKKAQEELLRSETKFRELADFLPELLFEVDPRGYFTYVNRVAYTVYGYTPADITRGVHLLDVVVPEDRDRTFDRFKNMIKGSWLTGDEYSIKKKDGTVIPVIIHGRSIIHDGAITGIRGIVVDITERKKAESALRESEEKFRRLFEDAGTAQFLLDGTTVIDCNSEAVSLLRCPDKKQILQNSLFNFTPGIQPEGETSVEKVQRCFNAASQHKSESFEFLARRHDGSMITIEAVLTAIPMTGRDVFHASARDITEQKRLQSEIINIIDVEQQRLGRDLHDGLGQDLTGMAFMCSTLAKKLKERGVPETALSEEVTNEVYRIITRVRMLSRELYPPNLVENEITYTLEQFAANISSIFGIRCAFRQDPDLVITSISISTQIYYIVREAVNNAVRHGHAGNIKISLTRDKKEVILAVEDDGIGRPEAMDRHKGLGLRIMAYRMATINGTFAIQGGKEKGVLIYCTFPENIIRDSR